MEIGQFLPLPQSCFQPDNQPMLGIRVQRDTICEILAEIQGRNQPLIKVNGFSAPGSKHNQQMRICGKQNDWVNRANITSNPHLPFQGNGQASTHRAALLEEETQRLDLTAPDFEMSLALSILKHLLQLEGFPNQNAVHSHGRVSSFNGEFNYIVPGKKEMLSQKSETTHLKLRVIQGLKLLEGGQVYEKYPQMHYLQEAQL